MNYILLLGAGFSRNWGGWLASEVFDYLLGQPEIQQHSNIKQLLWKHKNSGGFESALAELQTAWMQDYQRSLEPSYNPRFSPQKATLDILQNALEQMFRDMNKAFADLTDWEFQNDIRYMVRTFLMKFDAIFTLNQDMLLETRYRNDNILLGSYGKWNGLQIPGMREAVNQYHPAGTQAPITKWVPEQSNFRIHANLQPYFKLHGSSEWRDGGTSDLLIMGGNKGSAIQSRDILKWYHQEFSNYLSKPNTRLMVIGYSFGDEHINHAIVKASQKTQLGIFIIDPAGTDVISKTNLTYTRPNNIHVANHLENALNPLIIGGSKRPLREIFGENTILEHNKIMQFFS